VSTGARQLSDGLDTAVTQIPTYSPDDVDVLTAVVSQPVTISQDSIGPGLQSAPLFAALALWLGGFAIALALQAVPARRLLSSARSVSIAGRGVLPGIALGAGQGVVVAAVVLSSVSVSGITWLAFTGGAVLVGIVSALANLGLAAVFGGVGRLIAIAMALIGLAAGLSATIPPVVAALSAPLPSTQALDLLRATLTGDVRGALVAAGILALYGITAFVLVFIGVASRRRVRRSAIQA
jgi:putative membrane protein